MSTDNEPSDGGLQPGGETSAPGTPASEQPSADLPVTPYQSAHEAYGPDPAQETVQPAPVPTSSQASSSQWAPAQGPAQPASGQSAPQAAYAPYQAEAAAPASYQPGAPQAPSYQPGTAAPASYTASEPATAQMGAYRPQSAQAQPDYAQQAQPAQPAGAPGAPETAAFVVGATPYTPRELTPQSHAQPRRRGPGWGGVVAACLLTGALTAGGTVAGLHYVGGDSQVEAAPTGLATGATTRTVAATGSAPDWKALTNAVANSVVSIQVRTSERSSEGSGVIYDDKGHIVTNHHVIAGGEQLQVTLADGRIFEAELTGSDPATDIAVIELKGAKDLTVAQMGDSSKVVTGQNVMAIGNPLGLSSTVTTGIVSALDRPVVTAQGSDGSATQGQQVYTNAIQIDAAVNPGNSGGPLFDETGKVIGITSSIATTNSNSSESSGSIGIGFAIPVNQAKDVADQLIKSGTVTHAYLGVSLDNGGATADGVTRGGAEITEVQEGSPAGNAGIEVGDVITEIDGKPTSQAAALTGYVRQHSAGDKVKLTVVRNGKEQTVEVTLAERKEEG